jgi:hypothetical protein
MILYHFIMTTCTDRTNVTPLQKIIVISIKKKKEWKT